MCEWHASVSLQPRPASSLPCGLSYLSRPEMARCAGSCLIIGRAETNAVSSLLYSAPPRPAAPCRPGFGSPDPIGTTCFREFQLLPALKGTREGSERVATPIDAFAAPFVSCECLCRAGF